MVNRPVARTASASSLGQQKDVSGGKEAGVDAIRLQTKEVHVEEVPRGRSNRALLTATATEDEANGVASLGSQSRGLHYLLEALLQSHIPGMEDDLPLVRPSEPPAHRGN